jgi:hypothetical protein
MHPPTHPPAVSTHRRVRARAHLRTRTHICRPYVPRAPVISQPQSSATAACHQQRCSAAAPETKLTSPRTAARCRTRASRAVRRVRRHASGDGGAPCIARHAHRRTHCPAIADAQVANGSEGVGDPTILVIVRRPVRAHAELFNTYDECSNAELLCSCVRAPVPDGI